MLQQRRTGGDGESGLEAQVWKKREFPGGSMG